MALHSDGMTVLLPLWKENWYGELVWTTLGLARSRGVQQLKEFSVANTQVVIWLTCC